MQAANEELQSSNEELEASNEELQSTNEELTTVNQELIVKGGELGLLNTELENLQNSTGFALVLLDQELHLQRYNKEAASLFSFSVQTIGKHIVSLTLPIADVLEAAKMAMTDGIRRRQQTILQRHVLPLHRAGSNAGRRDHFVYRRNRAGRRAA